jgi:hypothetical protein
MVVPLRARRSWRVIMASGFERNANHEAEGFPGIQEVKVLLGPFQWYRSEEAGLRSVGNVTEECTNRRP